MDPHSVGTASGEISTIRHSLPGLAVLLEALERGRRDGLLPGEVAALWDVVAVSGRPPSRAEGGPAGRESLPTKAPDDAVDARPVWYDDQGELWWHGQCI